MKTKTENIQKIKTRINKWLANNATNKSDGQTKYEQEENLYRGIRQNTDKLEAWQSRLFLGLTFGQVQSEIALEIENFVDEHDFYAILPFRDTLEKDGKKFDAALSAKAMQLAMKAQEQKMNLRINFYNAILDSSVHGEGWSKMTWHTEKRKKEYLNYNKKNGTVEVVTKEYEFNAPLFESIKSSDMIIDVNAPNSNIDDAEFIGNYYWINPEELLDNKYYNDQSQVKAFLSELKDGEDELPPFVKLAEIWYDNSVCVSDAEGKYVLKHHITPYKHNLKPYAVMIKNPLSHSLEGISTVEMFSDIQNWMNVLTNGTIDEMRLTMHKILLMRSTSPLTPNQIKRKPGLVIKVDDIQSDLKELPTSEANNGYLQQTAQMDAFTNQILGNTDMVDSKATKTATEARISSSRANARINLFINYNKSLYLHRILKIWIELNQQFLTPEDLIKIVPQKELEKIEFEKDNVDLDADFIFKITGDQGMDDKALMLEKIQTMLQGLEMINHMPELVDKVKISQALIRSLDYDPDTILAQGGTEGGSNVSSQIGRQIGEYAQSKGTTPEKVVSSLSQKLNMPPQDVLSGMEQAGGIEPFLQQVTGGQQ